MKLSPAHVLRYLAQSVQANASATALIEQYMSNETCLHVKLTTVDGTVTRLEKASSHETEMVSSRHEKLEEALEVLKTHTTMLHRLQHIRFVLVALREDGKRS